MKSNATGTVNACGYGKVLACVFVGSDFGAY